MVSNRAENGAAFIINQLGYDSLKQDELLRYMALKGLDAVGPVTLETLAVQHAGWPAACAQAAEVEIFCSVAGELVNQIRFPQGPPGDWEGRDSQVADLMNFAVGRIMDRSARAPDAASAGG